VLPQSLGMETPKGSFLETGLRVTGYYDDNVLNTHNNKQHAWAHVIEPHLGWALLGPRYNWQLDYQFGLSTSYPLSIYDAESHLLDTAMELNLTRRLKVRLRNRFNESKDPFARPLDVGSAAGFGVLDRPNDSNLVSLVRRNSEQAGVDMTYALGPHSIAAVTASYARVHYGRPAAMQVGLVLEDSTSSAGHALYVIHLRPNFWAGFEYNVQKLTVESLQPPVLVNNVFYTQTVSVTPKTTLALFAGPEYFTTQRELTTPPAYAWQWAGGGTFTWTISRAALVATGYHKISDGGGLFGAVRVTGGTTQLRYPVSPSWTATLTADYMRNRPLLAPIEVFSYGSGVAGLERRFGRNLSLELGYGREYLPVNASAAKFAKHNRASVSLAYQFKNPVGR
jgi:hypothetical protein